MKPRRSSLPRLALVILAVLLAAMQALGADLHVLVSGAFTEAFDRLAPQYEKATGQRIVIGHGASMGGAADSIPSRLDRKETVDIVILAAPALEDLIRKGQVVADSRMDLVRSSIGMAVRAGAPKPDISTVDALKKTLLAAKSIAYSESASGAYLANELFPRLGLAEALKGKARRIVGERTGTVVARGEAELGFQQVSELLPIPGIDYVGKIPDEVQQVTVFSAGIVDGSKETVAAWALLKFLISPEARPFIAKTGLDPVAR